MDSRANCFKIKRMLRIFTLIFCLVFTLGVSLCVRAEDKSKANTTAATNRISGHAELLSHFVERGLSMSNGNPALNASFLFNLGSQVRLGFWGSNISNLSATDDNFWFKFLAEFDIRYNNGLLTQIYISDNHFYKSDQRNGQRIGTNVFYYLYQGTFEWMSNLEGSHGNAEYLNFGKWWMWGTQFKFGPFVGFTNSHTNLVNSYFDVRAAAEYTANNNTIIESAVSLNFTDANAFFGKRADPAIWVGVKLTY